jgi:anti-sigma factor RsiW
MDGKADPITEADLQAYVEDQLAVARRIEVEAHLCRNPVEAARVMADLRIRDELRLALADVAGPRRIGTGAVARKLERGLSRGRILQRLRRAAAIAVLLGTGWLAHAELGPLLVGQVVASPSPPAYVADAVRAHRTASLRAGMSSQAETPDLDAAEIRAATAIVMPDLPEGWTVADVQVFPSAFGPSVEMQIRAEAFGEVSLFAVRPGSFDVVPTTLVRQELLSAVYWQMGEVAYVLVANADARDLVDQANRLARSLY